MLPDDPPAHREFLELFRRECLKPLDGPGTLVRIGRLLRERRPGTGVFDVRVSEDSADTPALRAAAEKIAADEAFEQELNAEYRRLERARQQIARHVEITQAYLQRIQSEVARVQSGSP